MNENKKDLNTDLVEVPRTLIRNFGAETAIFYGELRFKEIFLLKFKGGVKWVEMSFNDIEDVLSIPAETQKLYIKKLIAFGLLELHQDDLNLDKKVIKYRLTYNG